MTHESKTDQQLSSRSLSNNEKAMLSPPSPSQARLKKTKDGQIVIGLTKSLLE